MKPSITFKVLQLFLIGATLTACGPTAAELRRQQLQAQQEVERSKEAYRKAAEEIARKERAEQEERLKREKALNIAADEEAKGKSAEASGTPRLAFEQYLKALQALPDDAATQENGLREAIIRLARRLDPLPAIPQQARDLAIRAEERLRLADSEVAMEKVLADYRQALRLAPWWGDGYFNQALVLERAFLFAEAREAFRYFLLAAPDSPDEGAVRRRMIALEVREEELRPTTRLVGAWREKGADGRLYGDFVMTLKGTTLTMTDRSKGKKLFAGGVAGSALNGTYYHEWTASLQDHYRPYCPADFLEKDLRHDVPITAAISEDGSNLGFRLLVPRISIMDRQCRYEGYFQWDKTFVRAP